MTKKRSAKIIPFEKKTSRNFFRLSFAFAACAAIVVICFGVWLQILSGNIKSVNDLSETITPPINVEIAAGSTFAKLNKTADKKVVMRQQKRNAVVPTAVSDASRFRVENLNAAKTVSAGRAHDSSRDDCVTSVCSQRKSVKNIEVKKPSVKLTKEEKYAYNQLMLALSITSSKLKLVTDKIENVEENKVTNKND